MILINNSKHWLVQQAILQPDSVAIKSNTIELTYKEFYQQCVNAAGYINSFGVNESSHVGILFDHRYEFFVIVNALWLIGAVPIPLNTRIGKEEIETQIKQGDIKFLIFSELFSEKVKALDLSIKSLFLSNDYLHKIPNVKPNILHSTFNTLHSSLILFTSGSSGKPKAVVHTFESIFESVKAIDLFSSLTANDTWLSSLPLYHIGGFMILIRSLIAGSSVIFPLSLKHEDIIETVNKFQPSCFSIVSTTLKRFLECNAQPYKNLKYVYLGGGLLDTDLCLKALKHGWPIVKVYGSTETCSMVTALKPEELPTKPYSAGKVIGENKIKIVKKEQDQMYEKSISIDDRLKGIGEIAVESKSLFKEYFNDQPSTKSKLKEGFYYTGDWGWLDEQGYLFVESRREDLVITGGENVSTYEVETIIKSYQAVIDAHVFGIPDKVWGQKLYAAVIAEKTNENDLKIFLKDKIAGYKIPKEFFFVNEIPKTEMGKVNRLLLFKLLNLG